MIPAIIAITIMLATCLYIKFYYLPYQDTEISLKEYQHLHTLMNSRQFSERFWLVLQVNGFINRNQYAELLEYREKCKE